MINHRKYAIFSVTELDKIDFSLVCETNVNTLRRSVSGDKTFVKWDNEQPEFISTLTTLEGPYTHAEILNILNTDEWTESENNQ
jgi:hypothetical protein